MTDTEPIKQTFPYKLYHALEWASNSEFSSALTWSESGDAFLVHDREAMVENIIPHFFDHKKWRSFTRQLNLWGFKRELRGPNSLGETYYHKDFKRGKVEDLQLIERTEIKRRSVKKQLSDLPSSMQSSMIMTSNDQSQAGDIAQGASFLTGLKGAPDVLRSNVVTGGGFPTASYYGSMQGHGQISSMIPFNAPSRRPPPIAPEATQMFQSQVMPQMMMQPQMFQAYTTGNWNPNQFSREMLDKMPTQQLVAMASNINGINRNSLNLLQSKDGPRAISDSSIGSSLTSTAPPKIDASNEDDSTFTNVTTRAA